MNTNEQAVNELIAAKKAEMERIQTELQAAQATLREEERKAEEAERKAARHEAFDKNVKALEPVAQALVAALKSEGLADAGYENAKWSDDHSWNTDGFPSIWSDKTSGTPWGYQIAVQAEYSRSSSSWRNGPFVGWLIVVGESDRSSGTRASRFHQAKDGSFKYEAIAKKVKEKRQLVLEQQNARAKREGLAVRNGELVNRLIRRYGEVSSFDKTRCYLHWAMIAPSTSNEARVTVKDIDYGSLTEAEAEEVLALAARIRAEHKAIADQLKSERSAR